MTNPVARSSTVVFVVSLFGLLSGSARAADNVAPDLPDRPGAVQVVRKRFDPVEAAARDLRPIAVAVSETRSFDRSSSATLRIAIAPSSLAGQVEFAPTGEGASSREALRCFFHGQEGDVVRLDPGDYTVRFRFWKPGEPFPHPYPHTTDVRLRAGWTATLELTREEWGRTRKWLNAMESLERRKEALQGPTRSSGATVPSRSP
ncbi:hypothetical protein JW916_10315 [Candidatus Sumerlaeota bacterium]|nr:hypothetical protein [Candidatus Sumerlaeota bacterium]